MSIIRKVNLTINERKLLQYYSDTLTGVNSWGNYYGYRLQLSEIIERSEFG